MDVHVLDHYPPEELDKLLDTIAFFRKVRQLNPKQFDVLLQHSQIKEFKKGELVIEAGQKDQWLYFLLKGQLAVFAGEGFLDLRRVGDITPGEGFGDLAVLLEHKRSATVISDTRQKRSLVLCTDFSIFGSLEDFSVIDLSTKLIYYRIMVNNLRWKLEVYRSRFPGNANSVSHHKVRLYGGPLDTREELQSLDSQARELSELLLAWNQKLVNEGCELSEQI